MMLKPIAPMLAVPMSKADIRDWNDWVMEEKFDGWRLVVSLGADAIVAHTRLRKHSSGTKDQNDVTALLPGVLMQNLEALRPRTGVLVLDGELLAIHPDGHVGTSTDVPRKELAKRFVVFDVLMTPAGSSMMLPYTQRRELLEAVIDYDPAGQSVVLADARPCVDADTVAAFCHAVWDKGGEGLILKDKRARYEAGKRREAFVKIKKLFTAVCKVTGFEATRGKVMNRGAFASVKLEVVTPAPEHPETLGHQTTVKTVDDAELNRFNRQWEQATPTKGTERWSTACLCDVNVMHPALGRLLRIEYQDIAADGGLRHPRWDRWENE